MLPLTFQIKHEWWETQDRRIVSEATAENSLLCLNPYCYLGPRCHSNQGGDNHVTHLAILDESGFPTIEATIHISYRRLLLHQGQGGSAESC